MSRLFITLSAFSLMILLTLSANRQVPEWQGFSRRPLDKTTTCADRVLRQFGHVVRDTRRKPESGLIRLKLLAASNTTRSPPILTAYFDGDDGFSSVFIEARDRRVANAAWRGFKRECGLPDGS